MSERAEPSSLPFEFLYQSSRNGPSNHLLILLHGLGDSHIPFHNLARNLNLPQTATLTLSAPLPVPFIENGFQWYPSFDPLGDLLPNPNPTHALDALIRTLDHLIDHAHWAPNRIHLFGFGQGGSLACELALRFYSSISTGTTSSASANASESQPMRPVVTISRPLLSYPTSSAGLCSTPLLVFHPPSNNAASKSESESALVLPPSALSDFRRAFTTVIDVARPGADGIPRSRAEWEPIMKFWSDRLVHLQRSPEGFDEVIVG